MRIEFAHASRQPVDWAGGTLRIGSAADNDLRLDGDDVAPRHVRLVDDARGLVLEVERPAGRVYVNARPVRERAIVHLGDTLGVGRHRLRLCAEAPRERGAVPAPAAGPCTMALRAVAGGLSGRVWTLDARLELNAQGPLGMPAANALTLVAEGPELCLDGRALEDAVVVRVNGVATRQALLGNGDQLAIGTHRFVVDVSAPPAEEVPAPAAPVETPAAPARTVHRQMGWLLATAVVLAAVLAWLLLFHF